MESLNPLQQSIELSNNILRAIDQEDWDAIYVLDEERSDLIEQYFSNATDIDKPLTLQLKQLNDEIISRLNDLQQKNRQHQLSLTQSQKASRAYLDNV